MREVGVIINHILSTLEVHSDLFVAISLPIIKLINAITSRYLKGVAKNHH